MIRFCCILPLFIALLCATPASAQISRIRQDFIDYGFAHFHGCDLDILYGGEAKFERLKKDIAQAKHYIHIEYYKWFNDSIGRDMLEALAQRAANGVQVRLLYDAFGCDGGGSGVTPEFISHYREKGIDMVGFDPMRFPYVNHALHRLHRKMVVIDGNIVYTGGLNVADYYIHGKPELGKWADMHARLTGPIVDRYQQIFAKMWYRCTREWLDSTAYRSAESFSAHRFSGNYSPNHNQSYTPTNATCHDSGIESFVVDREPGKKSTHIRQAYISCLRNAQHRILIINPYIILVRSVRKALYDCIERGIEVEILLGRKGDNLVSEVSTAREIRQLSKRGAKVWLCEECFHHDKVIVVDDSLLSIGTANLDARSLSFDYEVNAYCISPQHCQEMYEYFHQHQRTSTLLTEDNWKEIYPRSKRRLGWWLKGIRGIL